MLGGPGTLILVNTISLKEGELKYQFEIIQYLLLPESNPEITQLENEYKNE